MKISRRHFWLTFWFVVGNAVFIVLLARTQTWYRTAAEFSVGWFGWYPLHWLRCRLELWLYRRRLRRAWREFQARNLVAFVRSRAATRIETERRFRRRDP